MSMEGDAHGLMCKQGPGGGMVDTVDSKSIAKSVEVQILSRAIHPCGFDAAEFATANATATERR